MVNLNKKDVTKANLLSFITDYDIYRHYIGGDISFRGHMKSPLRPKERNASFGFYQSSRGEIHFKDFTLNKTGDCFELLHLMYNLSFNEVLHMVVNDFNLQNNFYNVTNVTRKSNGILYDVPDHILLEKSNSTSIRVKMRKPTADDKQFWQDFGITPPTLRKFRVNAIEYIFFGDKVIKTSKNAYSFKEEKDGTVTYKIYQPHNKEFKWSNNHNDSVWQGWEQLPSTGDTLIVTKSLKDVMCIHDVLGLPAVALQAETVRPKHHVLDQLKNRFDNVLLWYDNDYDKEKNWGQLNAKEIALEYQLPVNLIIPDEYESKDFSDLVKNFGVEQAKNIFDTQIITPF